MDCVQRANAFQTKKGIFHDTQVDPSSSFLTIRSSRLLINGLRCRLSFFPLSRVKVPFCAEFAILVAKQTSSPDTVGYMYSRIPYIGFYCKS